MPALFRVFRPWVVLLLLSLLGCGGETGSGFPPGTPPTGTALGLDLSGHPKAAAGHWWGSISTTATSLQSEQSIPVTVKLTLGEGVLTALAAKDQANWNDSPSGTKLDKLVLLLTAERVFDGNGWQHRGTDEGMSTLLTPTGLPIQGGAQGAVTNRFNSYPVKAPLDVLTEIPLPTSFTGQQQVQFDLVANPMKGLPPGLYRLRANFGIRSTHYNTPYYYDLHYNNITRHQFHDGSYMFSSPLLPASGPDVTGKIVDANAIQARIPWTILNDYNSNGYSGVVAEEDSQRFALGQFSLIHDEVVLPRYVTGTSTPATYNLEPVFPFETYYTRDNIDWDWTQGEMSLEIVKPDGSKTTIPSTPIVARSATHAGPTTNNPAFNAWQPSMYGQHTVTLKGWMKDKSGRRYDGGGTYKFWIARRLTMATATFQGAAYPVGYAYGRDISFSPPVPADVQITATLYPDSDPAKALTPVISTGKATAGGVFGVVQGMKALPLSAAGEYHGKIFAQYTDAQGELWVCVYRHAGVVYAPDSPIAAHGKKLFLNYAYVPRGETNVAGYVTPKGKFVHLNVPYNSGDLLMIASSDQETNKIGPVLIYENKNSPPAWDSTLDEVGTTNLFMQTSNGLSPHMFPEYVTAKQYYYASAARPGFMARFLVADSVTQQPYWSTSPNDFGGQAGSSYNGDQPGDLYRFIGGIVKQDAGNAPAYAGYLSSGAILPKGDINNTGIIIPSLGNNNRVVAPGTTDIVNSKGDKARFFLTPSFRPGMTYTLDTVWKPALQVDPMVPATISLKLTYPDGTTIKTDGGPVVDGSWAGTAQTLSQPGVYRVEVSGLWNGFTGTIPGLPPTGGEFYVLGGAKPDGAQGLVVDRDKETVFSLSSTLRIEGRSTASRVHYALIMPGAVIAQGEAPVTNGHFVVEIDPAGVNASTPIFDLMNYATNLLWGNQAPGDQSKTTRKIMHLSLFSEETHNGTKFWDFHRVITRGTTVLSVK